MKILQRKGLVVDLTPEEVDTLVYALRALPVSSATTTARHILAQLTSE